MRLTQNTIEMLDLHTGTITPESCGRALARIDRQCHMPGFSRRTMLQDSLTAFFSDCEMSSEELCKVFAAYEQVGGEKLCAWVKEQDND